MKLYIPALKPRPKAPDPVLVLVYHEPGEDDSRVRQIAAALGAAAVTIGQLRSARLGPGDSVALLMPMRGGHYHEVEEVALSRGASWLGRMPPQLTARAIVRAARARGCGSVSLYYWRAKRFAEEQEEDVREIARLVEAAGLEVAECGECVAPLSLLGGRLLEGAAELARKCSARLLEPLAYLVEPSDLLEWLGLASRT